MYCSKCGKEIPENIEFCRYCGNSKNNIIRKKHLRVIVPIIVIALIIIATIIYYLFIKDKNIIDTTNNKITEDTQEIYNRLKIDSNNLIDKATVEKVVNNIRDAKIHKTKYYSNPKIVNEIADILLCILSEGPRYIEKELEYEPILYMNKSEKNILAVKANTVLNAPSCIHFVNHLAYDGRTCPIVLRTYVDIETVILYDIAQIEPTEIQRFYKIEVSDARENLKIGEKIILKGYDQSELPESYITNYYNINGEPLEDLLATVTTKNIEDISIIKKDTTITGIEQAIKDGMIGEDYITKGISESKLSFAFSEGNLQMYYDSWEECLEDAQKLGILTSNENYLTMEEELEKYYNE